MVMAKINANTNVLMDGAVKVYRRPNTKKWQTNFQIAGHWIRLSTGKFDLEEAKAAAREHYLEYKFRQKNDLPVVRKQFADVARLAISDMRKQLDGGSGSINKW
jgi:hypothetical protein